MHRNSQVNSYDFTLVLLSVVIAMHPKVLRKSDIYQTHSNMYMYCCCRVGRQSTRRTIADIVPYRNKRGHCSLLSISTHQRNLLLIYPKRAPTTPSLCPLALPVSSAQRFPPAAQSLDTPPHPSQTKQQSPSHTTQPALLPPSSC